MSEQATSERLASERVSLAQRLDDVFRPVVPAERLAALRVLVGTFALVYLVVRAPALASVAHHQGTHFAPVAMVRWLSAPLSAGPVYAGVAVAIGLAVAFVAGWRFAITGPAFAVALLWVTSYRNSFGMIFHTENLLVAHVAALSLTDAAAAFSSDAVRRGGVPEPARRFGAGVVLLGAITTTAYLLAGIAKLRISGLAWITDEALRNQIAHDNVRKALLGDSYSKLGGWLVQFPWLFPPLAFVTIVVEVLAPLALLHRRLGRLWVLGIWSFHFGVLLTMWIFFPYQLFLIGFASFFEPEHLVRRVGRRFAIRALGG